MPISDKYRTYLSHFGHTHTCRDTLDMPASRSAIILRHDVDHDLDIALEMARVEHDAGFRATYFLLHTAGYWTDPALVAKCLQLQDYGHEVGLHVNLLTEWMQGTIDDPTKRLHELLEPLRAGGVEISGIAAHGDRACYERHFINYWCFRELRPDNPVEAEDGRTAEGPRDITHRSRISYPLGHTLTRADGRTLPLWSTSMTDAGIAYHAWHLPFDHYFSDSGGGWTRSADPLTADLSHGRHQVLMHPLYWQGMKRTYFFLSTARSGSKWLARFLDEATPLAVRHEYMLNQSYYDGETADKPTALYGKLAADPAQVGKLLANAWERRDKIEKDYAEVNVYLESQPDLLKNYFPEARYTLLTRNPKRVVRSIVNRGWYETPTDFAHRAVDVPEWVEQGQFGRACLYVADTLRRLRGLCTDHIRLEDAVADLAGLTRKLESLGIVVHPRLAASAHSQVIDATGNFVFPQADAWTDEQAGTFEHLCGEIAGTLGYSDNVGGRPHLPLPIPRPSPSAAKPVQLHKGMPSRSRWFLQGYRIGATASGHPCIEPTPEQLPRRFATLGGYLWQQARKRPSPKRRATKWRDVFVDLVRNTRKFVRKSYFAAVPSPREGWPAAPRTWIMGSLASEVSGMGRVAVYLLGFKEESDHLVQRKMLGVLTAEKSQLEIACRVHPDADRFDVAIYALAGEPATISVLDLTLRQEPMPEQYSALDARSHE